MAIYIELMRVRPKQASRGSGSKDLSLLRSVEEVGHVKTRDPYSHIPHIAWLVFQRISPLVNSVYYSRAIIELGSCSQSYNGSVVLVRMKSCKKLFFFFFWSVKGSHYGLVCGERAALSEKALFLHGHFSDLSYFLTLCLH